MRLFLALWPDEPTLQALGHARDGWQWPPGAALVPPDRLHVTLHFLGAVPLDRLPALRGALVVPGAPCTLAFDQAEVWPRGLAVLAASAVPPALAALHGRLAQALAQQGLPVEARPWRPHVTLARRAAGAVPPAGPVGLRWPVRGHALVQSQGGYRTLAHYPPPPAAGAAP